jgi:benzoyl-CoA reductase subunit B
MLAVAWWRGKKIAVDILTEVKAELDERVANGISALANEKHRVALVSNPPWYKVQMLPDWLAEANAVIVSSLLTGMVVDHTDVSGGSFKEVMSALVKHVLNYNIAEKIKVAEKQVVDWKCDCMALMDNRGCKIIAFPVPEIMAELEKKLNLPCFRFQGNMCDPRDFNEQEVRSQFETFIELLEQR